MTDAEIWDHWAENHCDQCDKRIHVNAGALCVGCALDFRLADDPWGNPEAEPIDDVFAVSRNDRPVSDTVRREAETRRQVAQGFIRRGGVA